MLMNWGTNWEIGFWLQLDKPKNIETKNVSAAPVSVRKYKGISNGIFDGIIKGVLYIFWLSLIFLIGRSFLCLCLWFVWNCSLGCWILLLRISNKGKGIIVPEIAAAWWIGPLKKMDSFCCGRIEIATVAALLRNDNSGLFSFLHIQRIRSGACNDGKRTIRRTDCNFFCADFHCRAGHFEGQDAISIPCINDAFGT